MGTWFNFNGKGKIVSTKKSSQSHDHQQREDADDEVDVGLTILSTAAMLWNAAPTQLAQLASSTWWTGLAGPLLQESILKKDLHNVLA